MDPQLQQRLMIFGGFIPGGISLIALIAVWYIHAFKESRLEHERDEDQKVSDGPRWMLPLMLLVGFAGADYAANKVFHLWPDSNNYRYTHAIALIALVGILEGLVRLPILAAFVFRILAFGGAFWMLTEGYPGVFGDTPTFVGSAVFAAIASALVTTASDRNSEHTQAWVDASTWIVIAGASMPILLLNHFSTGAMIPAGIIAVLVSALITGTIFRNLHLSRGGVTVLVGLILTMLTGSIIQTGAEYLPALLLLGVSPMVSMIPMRTASGFRKLAVRLVLLVVILGSAGGLLQWSTTTGDAEGDESYVDDDYGYETESDVEP